MRLQAVTISFLLILLLNGCLSREPFAIPTRIPSYAEHQATTLDFDSKTQLKLAQLVDHLEQPVLLTTARDGTRRLFIIEKAGRIRIYAKGKLEPTPFLDISERVNASGNEQGLLGLAFSPEFAKDQTFFVNYTNVDGDTVVARFRVSTDADIADPESETEVLQIDQPAGNHNGGMISFGPDGMLWIGMGDGGGGGDRYGNGQNPETLLGKMLRIDVTSDPSQPYTVLQNNARIGDADSPRAEIWAAGLRNPWRFSFDRVTGDLWIGDVGQNQIEEIDRVAAHSSGLNFGWPIMEGTTCYKGSDCTPHGLVGPVSEYKHGEEDCAVTGGYVYRGSKFAALAGVYLYGDYCSGRIWAVWFDPTGQWQTKLLLDSDLRISSFGEDEAGELYVVDYGGAVYSVGSE